MNVLHAPNLPKELHGFFGRLKENINLPHKLITLKQIHSDKLVRVYGEEEPDSIEADALWTTEPGVWLGIKTADCMPILVYHENPKVVLAIHAGFRGVDNQIIQKSITEVCQTLSLNPGDLCVAIGPSIGPKNYPRNLWQEAKVQLHEIGVNNIYCFEICTFENQKDYFSYRGAPDHVTGRQLSVIGIR